MSKGQTSTAKLGGRNPLRVIVDVCLALTLVLIQATALIEEAPHEALGLVTFALVIAHVVIGRKRVMALIRGRKSVGKIIGLAIDVLMVVLIIAQIASCIVLSKHVFSWLPVIPGVAWARPTHLLCGYWLFVLAFIHAGINVDRLPRPLRENVILKYAAVFAFAASAIAGAYFFFAMGLPSYLFMKVQFSFADPSVSLLVRFVEWACIASMFTAATRLVIIGFDALKRKLEKDRNTSET